MDPIGWIGLAWLFWACLWGGIGAYISAQKGRNEGEGMFLGAVLGPLGLFIAVMMPPPGPKLAAPPALPYQHKPRKLID
jgi:hypothetical protein